MIFTDQLLTSRSIEEEYTSIGYNYTTNSQSKLNVYQLIFNNLKQHLNNFYWFTLFTPLISL